MTPSRRIFSLATCRGIASSVPDPRIRIGSAGLPFGGVDRRRFDPTAAGVLRLRTEQRFLRWLIRKCGRPISRISISMSSSKSGSKAVLQIGYADRREPSCSSSSISTSPARRRSRLPIWRMASSLLACRGRTRNFFYLNQEKSSANSIYHALQTSLHISSWHGLDFAGEFRVVALDRYRQRSGRLYSQPGAAAEQHQSGGRPRKFQLRHPPPLYLELQLRVPQDGWIVSKLKNGWGMDGVVNLQDGQPWQLNYEFEGDYSGAGRRFRSAGCGRAAALHPSNPSQFLI